MPGCEVPRLREGSLLPDQLPDGSGEMLVDSCPSESLSFWLLVMYDTSLLLRLPLRGTSWYMCT